MFIVYVQWRYKPVRPKASGYSGFWILFIDVWYVLSDRGSARRKASAYTITGGKMQTYFHSPRAIRTHDPSIQSAEDIKHGANTVIGLILVMSQESDSWPVRMGPIRCLETSVNNYHTTPCNNPEVHRFYFTLPFPDFSSIMTMTIPKFVAVKLMCNMSWYC